MATIRMLRSRLRLAERLGAKCLEPRIELKRVKRMSSFTSRTKRTRDSDSSWSESSPDISPQFMRKRQTASSFNGAKTLSKTNPKTSSTPWSLRSSKSIKWPSETLTASSAKRGLRSGTKLTRDYSSFSSSESSSSVFKLTKDYSSSSSSSSSDHCSSRLTRKQVVAPSSISKKYAKTSAKTSKTRHYSSSSSSESSSSDHCSFRLTRKRAVAPSSASKKYAKTSAKTSKAKSETKSKSSSTARSLRSSDSLKWPCITNMAECQKRDEVLRHYITGHEWYQSQEFHLLRTMIMAPDSIRGWKQYLDEYSLLYDVEWESNGSGKGDLLCTDGRNRFLVVELKTLKNSGTGSGTTHRTGRNTKKRSGKIQAVKFAKAWHKGNPQVEETIGIFVTDEDGVSKMIELPKDLSDSSSSSSSSDSDDTDFTL